MKVFIITFTGVLGNLGDLNRYLGVPLIFSGSYRPIRDKRILILLCCKSHRSFLFRLNRYLWKRCPKPLQLFGRKSCPFGLQGFSPGNRLYLLCQPNRGKYGDYHYDEDHRSLNVKPSKAPGHQLSPPLGTTYTISERVASRTCSSAKSSLSEDPGDSRLRSLMLKARPSLTSP